MPDFHHISVLLEEAVGGVFQSPDGIYLDCTLGGGGHAAALASRLSAKGRIIGIDRDRDAVEAARARLSTFACQVDVVQGNFKDLAQILDTLQVPAIDGVLFDLGVSSHQIDERARGFSYMQDAPLDMRMDQRAKYSAYDVINQKSEAELAQIFWDYGEERWGKRIAAFIVAARKQAPLQTTGELVNVIRKAIPKAVRMHHGHPAKRVFQAIRIEVNGELEILASSLRTAVRRLHTKGRIGVITFHSLEDRIVKRTFHEMARGCICPPELPVCVCGHHQELRLVGKPQMPSVLEIEKNPRAKSARLRLAEKLTFKEGEKHVGATT